MSKSIKRSLKSGQVGLRTIIFSFDAGTDTVSGFDQYGIKSVTDVATGQHTFIFERPFERACLLAGHSVDVDNSTLAVVATAYDRITVQTQTGGVDADISYTLMVVGSDDRMDR